METKVTRLLDAFDAMQKDTNINACFGAPVTVEGTTVIPVAKIGYGFGLSTGLATEPDPDDEGESSPQTAIGGGGGGLSSSPIGLIEVQAEGIRVEPIVDGQRVAIAAMLVGAWSVFWLSVALIRLFGQRD